MSFSNEVGHLGLLETFDERAFEPNEKWPSGLCHFILALAVASNDLHDIFLALFLLKEAEDAQNNTLDVPFIALSKGTVITLRRAQVGVIHELMQLLKRNENIVKADKFKQLYKQLSLASKESWDRIYGAAHSKPQSGTLGRALLLCRNKVGFHYDSGQIGKGYRNRFLDDQSSGPPVLSRGSSMRSRRFFFADAAIEQYMVDLAGDPEIEELFSGRGQLLKDINQALFEIVSRFINARGFGFKEYRHRESSA